MFFKKRKYRAMLELAKTGKVIVNSGKKTFGSCKCMFDVFLSENTEGIRLHKNTSKSRFLTSNSISYFCDSQRYIRSKYSLQICFNWSKQENRKKPIKLLCWEVFNFLFQCPCYKVSLLQSVQILDTSRSVPSQVNFFKGII